MTGATSQIEKGRGDQADAQSRRKTAETSVQFMRFTLTGFRQDEGCRVFEYEGTGEDRVRAAFTVRADLAMSRKYGIRLQELPLMCLAILERNSESAGDIEHTVTFTEEAMMAYAEECAAAKDMAALKRATLRRQPPKTDEFASNGGIAPLPAKPNGHNW